MDPHNEYEHIWRAVLGDEASPLHRSSRIFRLLPSSPRCKICYSPFSGPGGLVMRLTGRSRSRMNPNMCSMCEDMARGHPGGAEMPLSLLFADIRGSTPLAESLGTAQFAGLIARFYEVVTDELIEADGLIDRLIGDEVVGLFVPGLAGNKHAAAAVRAAKGILEATGHASGEAPWVPVGVGLHTGSAFVGAVGKRGVTDITALGDDVNLAARLASLASAGEILLTESTRTAAGLGTDNLESRHLEIKGRKDPLDVWVMRAGPAVQLSEAGQSSAETPTTSD